MRTVPAIRSAGPPSSAPRPTESRCARPRIPAQSPARPSSSRHRFFGCGVEFAAGDDEIAFARNASRLPLAEADSHPNELLVGYCEETLARRSARPGTIRASVENAVAPLLPHGKARVTDIARALGMSRRVLARRLAAEGVSFTLVLEEMRRELALQYFEDASLSVSRIAWMLGFHEVAAFTHAVGRWTGLAPTQARAIAEGVNDVSQPDRSSVSQGSDMLTRPSGPHL